MAYRFLANKLTVSLCVAGLALAGCAAPTGSTTSAGTTATPAEIDLRARSAAMQKTLTEAIALGGIAGLAARLVAGDNNVAVNLGFGGFFTFGAVAGAAAGTYVAYLQDNFASQESRIAAMRADLAANISETQATLQVMQVVLANQMTELRRLQAAVTAGTAQDAALSREIAEARANLAEMDAAAAGATGRFNEFTDARNANGQDGAVVDSALQQLSRQISEMRSIAENLAGQV